jgi:hypothetical protein
MSSRERRFRFDVTPEEAQPCAQRLAQQLFRQKKLVAVEQPAWPDAPYRTTLFTRTGEEVILYEVQGALDFHSRLRDFAQWLAANRKYAEMFVVADSSASTTAALYTILRKNGAGLLIFRREDDLFENALTARNPALQVTPDPALRYGDAKKEVSECVDKFNVGSRKDALRDLCEFVERETEKTLIVASRKQIISVPEAAIEAQDFAGQINTLGSAAAAKPRKPLIDSKLKDDLHSFRGARNLLDHKVRSKKQEQRRQCQMAERMMMGTRLMSELISMRRRLR